MKCLDISIVLIANVYFGHIKEFILYITFIKFTLKVLCDKKTGDKLEISLNTAVIRYMKKVILII